MKKFRKHSGSAPLATSAMEGGGTSTVRITTGASVSCSGRLVILLRGSAPSGLSVSSSPKLQ